MCHVLNFFISSHWMLIKTSSAGHINERLLHSALAKRAAHTLQIKPVTARKISLYITLYRGFLNLVSVALVVMRFMSTCNGWFVSAEEGSCCSDRVIHSNYECREAFSISWLP